MVGEGFRMSPNNPELSLLASEAYQNWNSELELEDVSTIGNNIVGYQGAQATERRRKELYRRTGLTMCSTGAAEANFLTFFQNYAAARSTLALYAKVNRYPYTPELSMRYLLGTSPSRQCLKKMSFPRIICKIGDEMKNQVSEAGNPRRKLDLAVPNMNVTPLIDVLLVLLIIFMVIQPQKEAKFESQIPQKPEKLEGQVPPTGLLMVDVKSGTGLDQIVELNSKPMALIELGAMLRDLLEQRPGKTVYVKAPKDKQYGDIVQVIDVLKGAGADPIGLQIDFLS
jgi:biopolymer transport protein ExbD